MMNFALQQPTASAFRVQNRSRRALSLHHHHFFLHPCSSLLVSPTPRSKNAIAMEQDEREVPDLSEGKEKQQGGDAPVPGRVAGAEGSLAHGAASSEQEGISGAGNGGCHAAAGSKSDEEENVESEASVEELERVAPVGNAGRGDVPGSGRNEDLHFELRGLFRPTRRAVAVAHATPPSSYRRLPLRSRKQYIPTRFIFAGDAASGVIANNAHDPGTGTSEAASVPPPTASLASPSATSWSAGVSALASAGHGAKNEAMVSMATKRSEIDAAVDKSCYDDHNAESKDVEAAATARASSSCRHPSRGRKQRRPDRCISDPEGDAGDAARAKARRGNVVLDRFLAYLVRTSPEQRPEWVRNVTVTADNAGVQGQRGGSNVSRTASRGGPEGPPDGGARILAIVAILGASLALSLVSCVLFYIVGQRAASGLPDTHQKK